MALSSAFEERLQQMEHTRNQRLSLLQAEKELQANKSKVLATKLANIRSVERRCLILDQKIASQNLKILTLKSEIENLDNRYGKTAVQLRDFKDQLEELQELEKARENFYELKSLEMKEFRRNSEIFESECRIEVEKLRNRIRELKSSLEELEANNGCMNNSEVAEAEMRKAELMVAKENLSKCLVSNQQVRSELQRKIQNLSRR